MERIGQPDRADEFDQMSVDDYAEGKGRSLSNPVSRERNLTMANGATTTTKADLQDQIDSAISTLEDAYQSQSPPAKNWPRRSAMPLTRYGASEDEDEDEGDDDGTGDDLD